MKNNAYFIVNLFFVILIGIVLGYSYFFYPNNQPISCIVKEMTGKACSTCGFSRAFSAFTHFDFAVGKSYNKNAFICFQFFMSQIILRLGLISFFILNKKREMPYIVIVIELIFTISFFLIAFSPLLL